MTTEYLVMLTTSTKPEINCSARADSVSSAVTLASRFVEENSLTKSDLRSDFGEIMEIRPAADGIGEECKTIAYFRPTNISSD